MTKNLTIIRHAQSIWNANLHKSEQDAVRKNYIKCDILIVFSVGFGLKEPKILQWRSLKNVIK